MKTIIILLIATLPFSLKKDADSDLVISQYIKNAGGMDKVQQIKDLTIHANIEVLGTKYALTTYFKYPNKILSICQDKRGIERFRTLVLDSKMVRVYQYKLPTPVTIEAPQMIAKTNILRLNPFHELLQNKHHINTQAYNTMQFINPDNGRLVTVVPIAFTNDEIAWLSFYDTETKNKIGTLWSTTTRFDDLSKQEECLEEFMEYKNFDGINFPTKIRTSLSKKVYSMTHVNAIEVNQNISDKIFQIER